MKSHLCLAALLGFLVTTAKAEGPSAKTPMAEPPSPKRFFVGVMGGPAILTSPVVTGHTFFIFGARFGASVVQSKYSDFSLGVSANAFLAEYSAASSSVWRGFFTAEALSRRFMGTGLYLGGRGGVATIHSTSRSSVLNGVNLNWTYAVGPVVGYELQIHPMVSLTADMSWMITGEYSERYTGILGDQVIRFGPNSYLLLQGGVNFQF